MPPQSHRCRQEFPLCRASFHPQPSLSQPLECHCRDVHIEKPSDLPLQNRCGDKVAELTGSLCVLGSLCDQTSLMLLK